MQAMLILYFVAVGYIFFRIIKFLAKITPNFEEKVENRNEVEKPRETQPKPRVQKATNQQKEKNREVYLSTVAKTWLKENFSYLNEVFNDAENNTALLSATNLPNEKSSWQYIGEILKSSEEIEDFEIKNNGIEIHI